ncbi:hypothetical protein EAF04_008063 [Stromatinia cepivora]|nr:hypothetical protein EAF04_008063 [Stromatinia cepivora]
MSDPPRSNDGSDPRSAVQSKAPYAANLYRVHTYRSASNNRENDSTISTNRDVRTPILASTSKKTPKYEDKSARADSRHSIDIYSRAPSVANTSKKTAEDNKSSRAESRNSPSIYDEYENRVSKAGTPYSDNISTKDSFDGQKSSKSYPSSRCAHNRGPSIRMTSIMDTLSRAPLLQSTFYQSTNEDQNPPYAYKNGEKHYKAPEPTSSGAGSELSCDLNVVSNSILFKKDHADYLYQPPRSQDQ